MHKCEVTASDSPSSNSGRRGARVLGAFIDALTWPGALERISSWARARESRYVCVCNAHSVVTANSDPEFRRIIDGADMATPDGMPITWTLRRLGYAQQQRLDGPSLMWKYCELAAVSGESIYLFGSTEATLAGLELRLRQAFPALSISGRCAPPFRSLSEAEDRHIVDAINASGASVVFVGLGCPKQEKWMAAHRGRVQGVMIGVGAAFDYHAGRIGRAPSWMQRCGLEWLHRLASEPQRLWRRYLVTNTLFVLGIARQLWRERLQRAAAD